jgi:glycosyltransferase involved in cell wall biosynthesis
MFVLPYGVDTQRFVPAPEGSLSDGPSVLFLANLYARKGIYTLLEAFETVATAIPQCRLDIAGDGPEAGGVRGKITAMSSRARIRMIGAISRDRVAEAMRSCAVFCVPSHGEPFGLTALEAMACGKPVVGTDAGGLAYLVDAPRGGRKVPVGDVNALATALIEILREPGLAESMGRHNRRFAVEHYDWECVIDRLETIYGGVLSA